MKLHLLGTTGYHPNDRRQTACLMMPEIGLVLDAGTAMYRVRDHLCTPTLDIFLTHAHLDHVIGLSFLFDVLYGKEMEQVLVHGEPDKLEAIQKHLFHEKLFPIAPPFTTKPLQESVEVGQGGRLSHFPLVHPGGAVGYRIDWPDRSLAYVTDTTAASDADYIDKIRGVDVLVHECYFPDGYEDFAVKTGHSCLTPVAEVACQAEAGRLILVHLAPLSTDDDPVGLDKARAIFPETLLGEDGMAIEF